LTKPATTPDEPHIPGPKSTADERERTLGGMLSMRMVHLFLMLRRTNTNTQPQEAVMSRLEWRVMTQLDGVRPLSLTQLADRLLLDRGQLSRTVKGMVERDVLTRSRKPGGPEIEIDLTDEGLRLRSAMIDRAGERDKFLIDGLDPADLAVAFKVVEHMIARAGTIAHEEETAANQEPPRASN